jgi:hypothetical protein
VRWQTEHESSTTGGATHHRGETQVETTTVRPAGVADSLVTVERAKLDAIPRSHRDLVVGRVLKAKSPVVAPLDVAAFNSAI